MLENCFFKYLEKAFKAWKGKFIPLEKQKSRKIKKFQKLNLKLLKKYSFKQKLLAFLINFNELDPEFKENDNPKQLIILY